MPRSTPRGALFVIAGGEPPPLRSKEEEMYYDTKIRPPKFRPNLYIGRVNPAKLEGLGHYMPSNGHPAHFTVYDTPAYFSARDVPLYYPAYHGALKAQVHNKKRKKYAWKPSLSGHVNPKYHAQNSAKLCVSVSNFPILGSDADYGG